MMRRGAADAAAVTPPAAVAVATSRGWQSATDAELVEATRTGETTAFDELVKRHMRRAYGVALRLVGERADAEDLVQDAFVAALRRLDTFDVRRPFAPWLLRIVFNRAVNLRKARALRRTQPLTDTLPVAGASPLQEAERGELRAQLSVALARLPERRRWIIELFELDGFSGPEIAAILEMPEGTVRWELHEGRRALRSALQRFTGRAP